MQQSTNVADVYVYRLITNFILTHLTTPHLLLLVSLCVWNGVMVDDWMMISWDESRVGSYVIIVFPLQAL